MRVVVVGCAALMLTGCGSEVTAPTDRRVTLSGTLSSLQSGAPIGGVIVQASTSIATTSSSASGSYTLTGSTGSWLLTFTAPGFLDRRTRIDLVNTTTGLRETMIDLAAPFSLSFYREFVRDNRDSPGVLYPLSRWMMAPRFFFVTRTIDKGDVVPDAVIDVMEALASAETPILTGGRYTPAGFSRGEVAPSGSGWIIVQSFTDPWREPAAGGDSLVGENPGRIRLLLRTEPSSPASGCGFRMAGAFYHELVHALGYYHTSIGFSVDNLCNALLPEVEYHARVAYSRWIGNTDPDTDVYYAPPGAASLRIVR